MFRVCLKRLCSAVGQGLCTHTQVRVAYRVFPLLHVLVGLRLAPLPLSGSVSPKAPVTVPFSSDFLCLSSLMEKYLVGSQADGLPSPI